MKKILAILFFLPLFALAQKKEIKHTVAAKESLSSIGRTYNINGRTLAEYNNIDYDKGLSVGQVLRIPVNAETSVPKNVPVAAAAAINENGSPVYHKVTQGEGLYGISRNYNVTIDQVKKWNNLSTDVLELDQNLIVGYSSGKAPAPVKEKPVVVKKEIKEQPAVKAVEENAYAQEPVEIKKEAVKTPAVPKRQNIATGSTFEDEYNTNANQKQSGLVSVFKSTSGWEDGKYYCLYNKAVAGSIVKITNTENNKVIYAKVLDIIPELTNNKNNILIVSNAGAAALGVDNEADFTATVEY